MWQIEVLEWAGRRLFCPRFRWKSHVPHIFQFRHQKLLFVPKMHTQFCESYYGHHKDEIDKCTSILVLLFFSFYIVKNFKVTDTKPRTGYSLLQGHHLRVLVHHPSTYHEEQILPWLAWQKIKRLAFDRITMKRRGPTKRFLLLVERCLLEEQKK